MDILNKIYSVLERPGRASFWCSRAQAEREIFEKRFHKDGFYDKGVQGADAFALLLGLGGQREADRLARHYEEIRCFDTGIFGTPAVLYALFDNGWPELSVRLLKSRTLGSYGWTRDHGATTLWEYWDGLASHNHHMYGAPVAFLFDRLLGVRPDFSDGIHLEPYFTRELNCVSGRRMTPFGEVAVSWKRDLKLEKIRLQLQVPSDAVLQLAGERRNLTAGSYTLMLPDERPASTHRPAFPAYI